MVRHNGAMSENPDLRSVRVEVEVDSGGSVDAPAAQAQRGVSKLGVIAVVAAVGFVAVLILLAQRFEDELANDAEPLPPTIAPGLVDGEFGDGLFSSAAANPTTLFQQTDGAQQLEFVVRSPSGFLGLTSKRTAANYPVIVRSVDGAQWDTVDVSLDDSIPAGLPDRFTRVFEQLLRTETGYALLMTTNEFESEGDRSPTTIRVQRLTSADGALWSIDQGFSPLDSSSQFTRVVSHGADTFVILAWPPTAGNRVLRDLLETQLNDVSSFGDICSAEQVGDGQLLIWPCGIEGEGLVIDAVETTEPDRFADFTECAVYLGTGSTEASLWVVLRGNAPAELAGANSLLSLPVIADDGRVVGVDFPSSPRGGRLACEGFLDLDDLPHPAVVVWDPRDPTRPVRHPIPDEIDVASLLSVGADPALSGSDLLMLVGSGLTSIDLTAVDLDTGAWEDVLTLPVRPDDETSVQLTTDGSQLIYLDSARVTVIQLGTGVTRYADSKGGNRPGFPQIIYADNDVVFARGANSIFKIDVPPA